MKTIKTWLTTVVVLLCSITASAATYSDWTSTNKGQNSSTSSNTYTIAANAGDVLTFDWLVSSESNYDWLTVTLNGSEIIKKSGEASNSYQYTFTSSGTYTMVVKYTKDGSVNGGSDYAKVYNIVLDTGGTGGDSDTENIVASGTCGDNLTWKLHDDGTLTIEGTGQMTSSPWSDDYKSCIKTIIVGEGVTSIGWSAFKGCSSLASITIPNSVTSIESSALSGCSSLTSITIPEGVTSIGYNAFGGCANLISIIVEEGNLVYDSRENCNAIIKTATNELIQGSQSTIIPNSVTRIGRSAFEGCSSLASITIPEGVTSIGDYAFEGCSSLASITIPEGVTSIGWFAFEGCSSLTAITLPEGVTSIGYNAFGGCANLTSIIVEEGNLVYDSRENCNAIIKTATNELIRGSQSTIIPNSVTSIDDKAFNGCTNLSHITIPNSVTSIGPSAFINTNLPIENNIRYAGTWAVEVTDDTKDKYTLRNNTTGIADYTFSGCTNLTAITIPESVTSIGSSAFYGCTGLTAITIPEGVTSIEGGTFGGCSGLTSITIPNSVTSIGHSAFINTNLPIENNIRYAGTWAVEVTDGSLTSYTLRDNTTGIADNMFEYYENMTGITLPDNLRYIGNNVCMHCRSLSLTSLTIPNGVISIGASAFMNCWNITSVTIPSSVTSIGERAFTGRGNGTFIVVDANNTVYDSRGNCNAIICTETNHLIAGCSTTIIPNSVTSIGASAFMTCGITSVIIPNGVTRIEYATFAGSALTSISIPGSVTSIAQYAFASCRSLKTITCRNVVPPTCEVDAFQDVDMGACALEVPLNSVTTYRETSPWSGFNISAIVPQTLVLNDGENFENEENMIVESITYTRNFKNTNWQALYVPFEIPYENIKDDFVVAYINDVHQFDDDDDGAIDRTQVEAIKVTGGVLKANYPYMIRAKVAGEKTITVTDATLYATEENSIDCSSVFDTYTFTGTYSKIPASELPKEEGYYALSGGSWKHLSANSSLGAFRMYMKIDSRDANATVEARAIEMRVIGDDEEGATGIENPAFETQESELIYDLQGRRVENPTKGLYIVDGRKVWVE